MGDFVTTADLATLMQVAEASLDTALASISISAAQATVRGYLGQQITLVSDDEVLLDGSGTVLLRLPERPVVSVLQVLEDSDAITDYVLRRSFLIRTDHRRWRWGHANIDVTYTHGWQSAALDSDISDSDFDSDHVPADLVYVTLNLARRYYQQALSGQQGVIRSETIGSYSYTLESAAGQELLPAERSILDGYLIEGYG